MYFWHPGVMDIPSVLDTRVPDRKTATIVRLVLMRLCLCCAQGSMEGVAGGHDRADQPAVESIRGAHFLPFGHGHAFWRREWHYDL